MHLSQMLDEKNITLIYIRCINIISKPSLPSHLSLPRLYGKLKPLPVKFSRRDIYDFWRMLKQLIPPMLPPHQLWPKYIKLEHYGIIYINDIWQKITFRIMANGLKQMPKMPSALMACPKSKTTKKNYRKTYTTYRRQPTLYPPKIFWY